jgi:hypothetical protein
MMEKEKAFIFPESLSKIISVAFHPLFTPLYGLLIIFTAPTFLEYLPLSVKKILFLVVLVNEVILPAAMLPLFRSRNIISSYTIGERHERSIPLFTTAIFYSITTYMIFRFQLPLFLKTFMLASCLILIAVTIINFWWKISIHGVGAGAITGIILMLILKLDASVTGFLTGAVIISGLVLTSRLRLNNHNPLQVWGGFLTGLSGMVLLFLIL